MTAPTPLWQLGARGERAMSLMFALLLQTLPTIDELEAKTPWTKEDRDVAMTVAKAQGARWNDCINAAKVKFARSREPAETIATAVLGSCLPQQKVAHRAIALAFRGLLEPGERTKQADTVISGWRSDVREEVIAAVLSSR